MDELELYGDHLAETVRAVTHADFARRQTEVRLVGVHDERSEQIAARGVGESGHVFIGPAFAAGRRYTYLTCRGDPGGCLNGIGGFHRYRYRAGDWAKQASATPLGGFGVSGLGTFMQPVDAAADRDADACRRPALLDRPGTPEPDHRPRRARRGRRRDVWSGSRVPVANRALLREPHAMRRGRHDT